MIRLALVASLALASCSPAPPPSVPRIVAQCELDGVRHYHNPATRDERIGEYIITCMKTKGYRTDLSKEPCASRLDLRDPACYRPSGS